MFLLYHYLLTFYTASYPDVSLRCARKGRREGDNGRLYPSHSPLQFITSHSRFALASAMKKNEAPEEEAAFYTFFSYYEGYFYVSLSLVAVPTVSLNFDKFLDTDP